MTGRERIEAALSAKGTEEFPAVICYELLVYRDHWAAMTSCPWWYQFDPSIEHQMAWRQDMIRCFKQDWFTLPESLPRALREEEGLEFEGNTVFYINRRTGRRDPLVRPAVGGVESARNTQSYHPQALAMTPDEIDTYIPIPDPFNPGRYQADGALDLPRTLVNQFPDLMPTGYVVSPLWGCYRVWGFEGMMIMMADRPDLVKYAAERMFSSLVPSLQAQAARGCRVVWIEECFTDMIHPRLFAEINVPILKRLTGLIRDLGMLSIYYYCGDPRSRLDLLLSTEPDALGLEEGKKGFTIDIEAIADFVDGRCALLGNLDAIGVLEQGTDDHVRHEIARQLKAGKRNGRRFIMSVGSPATPATPVERIRRYIEWAHELGRL